MLTHDTSYHGRTFATYEEQIAFLQALQATGVSPESIIILTPPPAPPPPG